MSPAPGRRCAGPCCSAELSSDAHPSRRFCSARCRYRARDARRSADPAWRERWRDYSRARYAGLDPDERAQLIARVRARRAAVG